MGKTTIKIKKLNKEAVIPSKTHESDVGLDLVATSIKEVDNGDYGYVEYGTGLAMEIPDRHGGFIYPRSSISKTGHILANSVGIIDPSFRGEIMVRFKTIPGCKQYKVGDRIAQMVIAPYTPVKWEEVDDLEWVKEGHRRGDNTNNVSATISIKPENWEIVGEWMWENRDVYNGLSVLPYDSGSYIQAPFESISKERYEDIVKHLSEVDLTKVIEIEDSTDLTDQIACAGGACEVI